MNVEAWKDIQGFEGLYQVSDTGRVRSLDRMIPHGQYGNPKHQSLKKGKILKLAVSNRGYASVVLFKDGTKSRMEIHRLVSRTFLGPLPDSHHTHHLDENKLNNSLSNLVYIHRTQHGHITHRGERCHKAQLTEENVHEVRRLLSLGWTQKRVAERYGVCRQTIGEINRGASWVHI